MYETLNEEQEYEERLQNGRMKTFVGRTHKTRFSKNALVHHPIPWKECTDKSDEAMKTNVSVLDCGEKFNRVLHGLFHYIASVEGEDADLDRVFEKIKHSPVYYVDKSLNPVKKTFEEYIKLCPQGVKAGDVEITENTQSNNTEEEKTESMNEDTIKQGNAWVNKGKEGTHGKFRTKKEADAQRKAMFANKRKGATFGEELNESAYEDFMNEIRSTDKYHKVSKILERAYKALSNEEYKKVYAEAQKVKKEIMAAHEGLKESRQNNEFYRGEVIWNYGDEDTFEVGFEGKPREFPSKEDAKKAIDEYRKDPHYLSKYERDYYSGPEEGGYTSTGLILIDSKRYPDYDSAVRALEVKQADYTEDELEYVGNDIFEDSYGYVYNVEHDKGSEHSPAKSWAEAELGEDFVARQADEVLEGAVGNLSDKEVDKLLGTLRKAKKLLGVNRIEDIYYVQSEDDPEDWQRELEFTKENINSKVDFFDSKKYNISVVREKLDNGSIALYFADEDSVNRYHDITGNYYDDNFDYSV